MDIVELLRGLAERLGTSASVKTVYGEPVTSGDRTIIPMAKVRYGFGGGGGRDHKEGGASGAGGGGGVAVQPFGLVEITPAGTRIVRFHQLEKLAAAAVAGFLLGVLISPRSPPVKMLNRRSD
jgi:uncharacterized spore protein YtfJ